MIDTLHGWISAADAFVWGPPLLILLFGTHIFLTIRTAFMQRHLLTAIRLSVTAEKGAAGDVSPFAALTTALAATIGTGNIVGVATAVSLGGPGAVLWMWLTGVLGMATKYSEALLAVKYRVKTADGTMLGGPMYALERGLGMKWLGVLFALFTVFASFGIGNMVQANSISTLAASQFGVNVHVTGIVQALMTAVVVLGGLKVIARVCELLVPFMAVVYIVGCVVILVTNAHLMLPAISLIVQSAFSPTAAAGGFVGATVLSAARYGVARGLFSNESGLGSAPIVAAAAQTRNPVRQALVSSTGTFWDTVVICLLSGLVVVTAIMADPALGALKGSELTAGAFHQAMPTFGPIVLTHRPADVRLLDDPRLVVLRRARRRVPVGQGVDPALPPALGGRGLRRLGGDARLRVGLLGSGQRPDGRAEPDRAAAAVERGRRRDAPLPDERPPRRRRRLRPRRTLG